MAEPSQGTQTFCLGCTAQQAIIELAASEILPSGAAEAPRNFGGRSLRTRRVGRRWPGSRNATHCDFDLVDLLCLFVLIVSACDVLDLLGLDGG